VLTGDAPSFTGTFESLTDATDTNGELSPAGSAIQWAFQYDVSVEADFKEEQELTINIDQCTNYDFLVDGVEINPLECDDVDHMSAMLLTWDGEDTLTPGADFWDDCTGTITRQ
jgi:hypothetical protein